MFKKLPPLVYLFLTKRCRIYYVGWLGYKNLGDEALFMAIKQLLSDCCFFYTHYLGKDKILFLFYEKITNTKLFKSIMVGGGTLIGTQGALESIKNFMTYSSPILISFGSGVVNPEFWSNVESKRVEKFTEWINLLKNFSYISVRGPLSKKILKKYGLKNVKVVGDPVLYLADKKNFFKKIRKKRIGINLGFTNNLCWGKDDNKVFNNLYVTVKQLLKYGWEISFFPACPDDEEVIYKFIKRFKTNFFVFKNYLNISKVLEYLHSLDLFIGEKLHSCILASVTYTPFIMLEYRPKCRDFMASMELESYNLRIDNLNSHNLFEKIQEIYSQIWKLQEFLYVKVNFWRNRLLEAKREIKEILQLK